MKKILLSILPGLLCTTAIIAQQKTELVPSGNVITRDVAVQPFSTIKADGLYDLILTQGDKEGVKVETDDNLQYLIEISNDGGTLVIDEPKLRDHSLNFKGREGESKHQRFKVYVTFKKLSSISLQVVGNIRGEGSLTFDALAITDESVGNIDMQLTATKLTVTNKGVGSVTLTGHADNALINNTGVGSFNGDAFVVQTMHINNTGVGHAEVNVVKDLVVKDSFLGKVKNSGAAATRKVEGAEM